MFLKKVYLVYNIIFVLLALLFIITLVFGFEGKILLGIEENMLYNQNQVINMQNIKGDLIEEFLSMLYEYGHKEKIGDIESNRLKYVYSIDIFEKGKLDVELFTQLKALLAIVKDDLNLNQDIKFVVLVDKLMETEEKLSEYKNDYNIAASKYNEKAAGLICGFMLNHSGKGNMTLF